MGRTLGFDARPLHDSFGAEIVGIDLRNPLSAARQAELIDQFHNHGVLLFRGQDLSPEQQIEFSRAFGPLEIHVQTDFLLRGHPEIFIISNVVEDGRPIGAIDCALSWHSDSSYIANPSLGSLLYGVAVPPEGANTYFAGMYAPYEALPGEMKRRLVGLKAVHHYERLQQALFPHKPLTDAQRALTPPIAHPIVRRHPVTGRQSLYLGGAVIAGVEGLPKAEGIALVEELVAFATSDRFVYKHIWQQGDLVAWDNRCTMHRGSRYNLQQYIRRMHRTTILGNGPPAA